MRIATILLAATLLTAPAWAHEMTMDQRLAAMEAQLAAMRGEVGGGCDGCGGGDCCCYDAPRGGWIAGAELTYLKVHSGSIAIPDAGLQLTPDYDYSPGYRIWAGYENCNGLGWRVTYWDFDDDASVVVLNDPFVGVANDLDFYTVDLEATQRAIFCGWNLLGSAGVRFGRVRDTWAFAVDPGADVALFADVTREFEGAGLTFALFADRQIGCSPFSIYSGFRGSLLFGDTDIVANVDVDTVGMFGATLAVDDQILAIWELQLGVKYSRDTSYGNLFARAGAEAQLWEVSPVVLGIGDKNIGLFGFTAAIGIDR